MDRRTGRRGTMNDQRADALSFTLQQASSLSGLSTGTLRRRAKEGALRLFRVGGRTLVDGTSLRRLLGAE